jgi:cytidine diphosphoramidate kinase
MQLGYVFWVTGLAGSGKTTIGEALCSALRSRGRLAVQLDGDRLREAFGGQHGYSIEERRHLSMCYARLCKLLADQGTDVVCSTVSMFDSVRRWNRDEIAGYREIYLTAPQQQLLERRAFYSDATASQDVVGLNPAYELPSTPDLQLHNDGQIAPAQVAQWILTSLALHGVPSSSRASAAPNYKN